MQKYQEALRSGGEKVKDWTLPTLKTLKNFNEAPAGFEHEVQSAIVKLTNMLAKEAQGVKWVTESKGEHAKYSDNIEQAQRILGFQYWMGDSV